MVVGLGVVVVFALVFGGVVTGLDEVVGLAGVVVDLTGVLFFFGYPVEVGLGVEVVVFGVVVTGLEEVDTAGLVVRLTGVEVVLALVLGGVATGLEDEVTL